MDYVMNVKNNKYYKNMKSYDKFLEYYDEIVRGINSPIEDEVEFLIKDVMEEHKPGTKNILEVACGT
jgi:serine protease inhibitor